ncbi:hypothetical protein ANRL3_00735 [Anaerolineae bacterium]|nr:hypothetical protein ANRL3_00735 [Anaerolineae bacterium]
MKVSRRDFLKDVAYAAALIGLPQWVTELDEPPPAEMMSLGSSSYPWQWTPPNDLGTGNPIVTVLNRIAFGPRPGDFERVKQIGVDAYIEEQLAPEKIDDSALDQRLSAFPTLNKSIGELMRDYPQQQPKLAQDTTKAERLEQLLTGLGIQTETSRRPADVIAELQDATMLRAVFSRRQLQEVLIDFWSNHFTIFIGKNDCRWMKTVDDREVIRKYTFGKFGDLLRASAQSPAMLEYLDNRLNVKGVANENYAREIMELHSLGVDGGYTQNDVAELARAFTGWTTRPVQRSGVFGGVDYTDAGTFFFDLKRHDTEPKRILGINLPANGGIDEALRIIEVLAKHPSTARYISKKLVTRFVSDNPPDALIQRAAETFTLTNGDIRSVLSTILHSDEFEKISFAQKIKRPFELVASAARALDVQTDDVRILSTTLRLMGQGLFLHVTPDGYPDSGSAWINTSALLARWNFAMLLASGKVPRVKIDLAAAMKSQAIKTAGEAVDFWIDRILLRPIPDADRKKLIDAINPRGASVSFDPARLPDLVALILASPHFQYR